MAAVLLLKKDGEERSFPGSVPICVPLSSALGILQQQEARLHSLGTRARGTQMTVTLQSRSDPLSTVLYSWSSPSVDQILPLKKK